MQVFLQKFNEQFEGKDYIEIAFCDDNPLIKKFVRYNQGGKACHCFEGSTQGKQKVNNKWQPVECTENCEYRKKNDQGKSVCNRIGWLRFLLPTINQDKLWLMKITGQKSINRLDDFIKSQKAQGTLLNNRYIIFLRKEDQTSTITGETFTNYILNIIQKEYFISSNQITQTNPKPNNVSTEDTQIVNNNVEKEPKQEISKPITTNTSEVKNTEDTKEQVNKKENTTTQTKEQVKTKKQTKSKTKKVEETPKEQIPEKQEESTYNFDKCYVFDSISFEKIATKTGETKEYAVGKFYDTKDKTHNIVIKPELENELQNCELGTIVEFQNIKEVGGREFALDFKFIQKMQKNIAA